MQYIISESVILEHTIIFPLINDKNVDLCMKVLEIDPKMLYYIPLDIRTDEMIKLAVSKDPFIIKYVKNPNFELCKLAIDKNYKSFKNIANADYDVCKYAISINPKVAKYINNLDIELQKNIVYKKLDNIIYINNPGEELCVHALIESDKNNVMDIFRHIVTHCVQYLTNEICEIVINKNYKCLKLISNLSEELIIKAVDINPKAILYINDYEPSLELCQYILDKNDRMINQYINNYLKKLNTKKWSKFIDKFFQFYSDSDYSDYDLGYYSDGYDFDSCSDSQYEFF